MTFGLLVLQAIVPAGMIAWLAWRPPASWLGALVQVGATGMVLWALALSGLWLFPPWWTPHLYGVLLVLVVSLTLRTHPPGGIRPASRAAWVAALGFGIVALAAAQHVAGALRGRVPPQGDVVDLAFPLGPGRYLVLNGGNHLSINAHLKTLDSSVARFRRWRGNSHGVDLIGIDPLGLRTRGVRPADPRGYQIYGTSVLAPCDGRVVHAEDGHPDQRIPSADTVNRAGNFVLLRCGAVDILLGHLRPNSVAVAVGEPVAIGEVVGEVGNSGASGEPHLHVHAQRPGSVVDPFDGAPLPVRLGGRYLVRGNRIAVSRERGPPAGGSPR